MYKVAIPIQTRFSDIDMFNHVNNTVYVVHIETARVEYFKHHLKMDLNKESAFTVSFEISYKKSAMFDDKLAVLIKTEEVGNTSLLMDFAIVKENDHSTVFAHGKVKQVHVNPETGKIMRVSDGVRDAIIELEGLSRDDVYPVPLTI